MTFQQYRKISKREFFKIYGYPKYYYYNLAKSEHAVLIRRMMAKRPGVSIVMHHIEPGCTDYELWKCVPMFEDEHIIFHQQAGTIYRKGRVESAELKARRSASLRTVIRTSEWVSKAAESNRGKRRGEKALNNISIGQRKRYADPLEREKNKRQRGKFWWNDGSIERMEFRCPQGFQKGRLSSSVPTERDCITGQFVRK